MVNRIQRDVAAKWVNDEAARLIVIGYLRKEGDGHRLTTAGQMVARSKFNDLSLEDQILIVLYLMTTEREIITRGIT